MVDSREPSYRIASVLGASAAAVLVATGLFHFLATRGIAWNGQVITSCEAAMRLGLHSRAGWAFMVDLVFGIIIATITFMLTVSPKRHENLGLMILVSSFLSLLGTEHSSLGAILGVVAGTIATFSQRSIFAR